MIQFKDEDYDATRTGFDQYEVDRLTEEMNLTVSGFFQDDEQEQHDTKSKTVHTYKCPYCGEVFEK